MLYPVLWYRCDGRSIYVRKWGYLFKCSSNRSTNVSREAWRSLHGHLDTGFKIWSYYYAWRTNKVICCSRFTPKKKKKEPKLVNLLTIFQFYVGSDILVAPVLNQGSDLIDVTFPPGFFRATGYGVSNKRRPIATIFKVDILIILPSLSSQIT